MLNEARKTWLTAAGLLLACLAVFFLLSSGRIDTGDSKIRYVAANNIMASAYPTVPDNMRYMPDIHPSPVFYGKYVSAYGPASLFVYIPFLSIIDQLVDSEEEKMFWFSHINQLFAALTISLLFVFFCYLGHSVKLSLCCALIAAFTTQFFVDAASTFHQIIQSFFLLSSLFFAYIARCNRMAGAEYFSLFGTLLSALMFAFFINYKIHYLVLFPAFLILLRSPAGKYPLYDIRFLYPQINKQVLLFSAVTYCGYWCWFYYRSQYLSSVPIKYPLSSSMFSSQGFVYLFIVMILAVLLANIQYLFKRLQGLSQVKHYTLMTVMGLFLLFAVTSVVFNNDVLGANVLMGDLSRVARGLFVLFLSPGKALIFYTPVLFLSIVGFKRLYRKDPDLYFSLLYISVIWVLAIVRSRSPGGDWAWGPRYIVPIIPVLMISISFVLKPLFRSKKMLVLTLCFYGLTVQLLGLSLDYNRFYLNHRAVNKVYAETSFQLNSQLLDRPGEIALSLALLPKMHLTQAFLPPLDKSGRQSHSDMVSGQLHMLLNYPDVVDRWVFEYLVFWLPRPWPLWMDMLDRPTMPINFVYWRNVGIVLLFLGGLFIVLGLRAKNSQ